jgi:hypothetical protein
LQTRRVTVKTIKLIFNTNSTNENYNADCDHVIVKITPERYQLIGQRIEVLRQLKERDADIIKLCAWDYGAIWVSRETIRSAYSDELLDELDEKMDRGYTLLPDDFDISAADGQSVEVPQLVVAAYGSTDAIYWKASPKHTDVYVESQQIDLPDLKGLMK